MTQTPTRTRSAPRSLPADGTPRRLDLVARSWAARLLPALFPGTLMLVVGLVHAGRPGLSWDEVTSAEVAQRSVPQIGDLIQNVDAVFGGYYVLLHYWSSLVGDSELQLRLPSIIAMAGGVAVAAELGRRLFTPLIGLITGLVLVILPNTSRYAAEVRPYAFACFFAVLALLLLIGAVRSGRSYRWVVYGLSVTLLGLFHLVALTTLAAHAVLVGLDAWRSRRPRTAVVWAGVVTAAMIPLLPIAWLGAGQEDTQLHWVQPLTLNGIYAMPAAVVGSVPVAWMLAGLVVLASWRPLRRLAPIAVFALAPMLALAVVSALVSPMWVARYLLIVLAPLAMLAAVALAGGRDGWSRFGAVRVVAVLLVLAAASVPGQLAVRTPTAKAGPDYRATAALIGERLQPGDVVVYPPRNRAIRAGMDYYLRRLPSWPADPLVAVPAAETGWLIADEHPDAAARLAGARRIWFVVGDRRADPVATRPELRPMLADYERDGLWRFQRATVALYTVRS